MSDTPQDPSWWQASDGKWYPPQSATPPAPQPFAAPQPYAGGTGSDLPSVNGLAVASMVLGIVSLVFFWCWFVGGPTAIVGLPLGGVALSRIKNGQADPKARGMAIAGLVMCIISVAAIVIFLIIIAGADTSSDFNFDN